MVVAGSDFDIDVDVDDGTAAGHTSDTRFVLSLTMTNVNMPKYLLIFISFAK